MPDHNYSPSPCPKCGRLVEATGEATLEDGALPVYECDAPGCTRPITFEGEMIAAPLIFVVGADGQTVALDLD
jgi:hypothetical protein